MANFSRHYFGYFNLSVFGYFCLTLTAQAPPVGTRGTVIGVDDTGSIMVAWDNGSGLNVIYGVDRCRKVPIDD